ncbi:MAG: DNA replication and repair protein RecF [Proteobacteria bacterium]|jgi:DNA replication and repair protein RecF|nr:DNA replication and repair protein RecF [Pseudomonadota bacterium]
MFQGIYLNQFRSYPEATFLFSPQVNVFVGKNGVGKSNLLEALCLLTQGDSFRYCENSNLIRHGSHSAFIKGKFKSPDLLFEISLEILKSKKNFQINNKRSNAADLQRRFTAVIFSPESLAAIKEGADLRRQLVDEAVVLFEPRNADLISEFRKALKARNRVLRDYGDQKVSKNETLAILESLEPIFLKHSLQLTTARIQALKALHSDFNNAMRSISEKTDVDISVEYVISDHNALDFSSADLTFLLKKRLFELRDAELSSGTSLIGPQKHDIKILYNQNDSRFYCSQGQQRALILSFKMAQIVYHRKLHGSFPILMLDDVLSELDPSKREALIRFLASIETQIFLTTTDLSESVGLNEREVSVIRVNEG